MLGLAVETDRTWVARASADVARVLVDHAHCEMKAASNALSLSARCLGFPRVTMAMVDVAKEELEHYRRVLVSKYVDGCSFFDIAAERGCSAKAAESMVQRAKQAFARVLRVLSGGRYVP